MIVITGCGRSGTKWAATALRHLGYDVQHEKMGRDGISSWCMAPVMAGLVDGDMCQWHGPIAEQTPGYWLNCVRVHLVRNPLDCIASLMTVNDSSLDWAEQYYEAPDPDWVTGTTWRTDMRTIDDPNWTPRFAKLRRCMRYWVEWNRLAESVCTVRDRLEGVSVPGVGPVNRREHGTLSWGDLVAVDDCGRGYPPNGLALAVMGAAKRYGYDVPLFQVEADSQYAVDLSTHATSYSKPKT